MPQAALLAGLPQAPTAYDPLPYPTTRWRAATRCCEAMWTHGYITQEEFSRASRAHRSASTRDAVQRQRHPNFFGWATQQLVNRFGERRRSGGRLAGAHDARPAYAEAMARTAVSDVLREKTDPAAAPRRDRPATGAVKAMVIVPARRARAAVQPRLAVRHAPGRQRVQAVHARDGDRPGCVGVQRRSPGRRS